MKNFDPLPKKNQIINASREQAEKDRNSLKNQALPLLADVNYMLVEAGQIDEAIIVIGPEYIDRMNVLGTLASKHFKLDNTKQNIHLPERIKINDKIFWECSNKINPNRAESTSILQVLVNISFIRGLIENSNKLKFVIVAQEKSGIKDTIDNFIGIIDNFISIFPNEECIKLPNNVMLVVTQFDKNNQTKFLEVLKIELGLLAGYFPDLSTNLRYLYNSETQDDDKALSLKLDDINKMSDGVKIKISELNLFLGTQEILKNNQALIKALYDEIQPNIVEIYNIINSVFQGEAFDIYKPCNDSNFLNGNYEKCVEKFFSKTKLIYQVPKQDYSYFQGLQQLSKFNKALDGWDSTKSDPLGVGLKILDIIKEFASDIKIHDYYYILDQQIKQLLFFQEVLHANTWDESLKNYKTTIEVCKSFIKGKYLSSIKDIRPEDNRTIEYYTEAIKWLNTHPNPDEITKTKSICYDKIGDIYSKAENHKAALANYNFALKYNKDDKKVYDKMANKLIKLSKYELAIEYCKINNLFTETIGCFDILISNASLEEKVTYLSAKADYLFSKKMFQEAAKAYSFAVSFASNDKKLEIELKVINALDRVQSCDTQPTNVPLDKRQEIILDIIGDYPEIEEHF